MEQKFKYTIDVTSNLNDLTKLQQLLKTIQEDAQLKVDVKNKKDFQLLLTQLNSFITNLEQKTKDGKINQQDFLGLQSQFKNIIKLTENFKNGLIGLSVSPKFKQELDDILKNIDNTKTKLNQLKDELKSIKKGWQTEDDGKLIPTKGTQNYIANVVATRANLSAPDSDKQIRQYETILKYHTQIQQKLQQEGAILTSKEEAIEDAWVDIQTMLEDQANNIAAKISEITPKIADLSTELEKLKTTQKQTEQEALSSPDINSEFKNLAQSISDVASTVESDYNEALQQSNENIKKHKESTKTLNTETKKTDSTFGKAIKNVVSYGTALQLVRSVYNQFIRTVTELDEALTGMTVVTSLSREQAWQLTGTLQDLAKQTGINTTEIANMTTMYLQQGKTLSDALQLTEAAAKAARIANISGAESINLLTNAMNGFQVAASEAMEVSDKFAALAAAAATDYEELATALSKVAAQANLAGMSMDFTLGLLTKGIEVTREAPETIGTALKTVIARMRELTDYGKTLEDGMDVNRVDKALQNIGVSLLDANREFRDLEDVLTEVGEKWDTLNTNQQANVAVALAGTRQQSRLIAIMQDFDRTLELVQISEDSAGATNAQHAKYMRGLEAAVTNLTTSYQGLITAITNSDIAIGFINGLSKALDYLSNNLGVVYGVLGAILALYGPILVAQIASNTAKGLNNVLDLIAIALGKETIKLDKKTISNIVKKTAAKINLTMAIKAETAAIKAETAATKASATAWKLLELVFRSTTIGSIIAAIVTLITLLAILYNSNESFRISIQQLFKTIGNFIGAVFSLLDGLWSLISIFTGLDNLLNTIGYILSFLLNIINLVVTAIGGAIDVIGSFFKAISNGIKNLISLIPGMSQIIDGIQWFFNNFGLGVEKLQELIDTTCRNIIKTIGSAANYVEMTSEEIAENQDKIYNNTQKYNQLSPLIDEYEELSNKANKTSEDIDRLNEIISQIGDIDSTLVINGELDLTNAKEQLKQLEEENSNLITENYNKSVDAFNKANSAWTKKGRQQAIDAFNTDPNYRAAIADYVSLNYDIDSSVAQQLFKDFQLKEGSNIEQEIDQLANAQKNFDQILNDEEKTMKDKVNAFSEQLKGLSEEGKNAFVSLYSDYKNILDLGLTDQGYQNFEKLGLNPDKIEQIKEAFIEAGGSEQDFNNQFQTALNQSNGSIDSLINNLQRIGENLPEEEIQGFKNALSTALNFDTKTYIDDLKKAVSAADKLKEASAQAAIGELDYQTLQDLSAEYPELFNNQDFIKAFMNGEDLTPFLTDLDKANQEFKDNLNLYNAWLESEIQRVGVDTEEGKALQAQLEANKQLLYLKDHELLLQSELYQETKAITEEEAKRLEISDKIISAQNKIDNSENFQLNDYTNLLALYQERQKLNKEFVEKVNQANELGANITVNENGEIRYNAQGLSDLYDKDPELFKWINDNEDQIEDAYASISEDEQNIADLMVEIADKATEAAKKQLETEKEILNKRKEIYENYWDEIDRITEEEELSQDRESILKQIAALSGGSDAATNQRRKELTEQLEELNQEQLENQKQNQRDALQESIEKSITSIDDKISALEDIVDKKWDNTNDLLQAILNASGIDINQPNTSTTNQVITQNTITKNAKGGLVNYTGLAWVDGTLSDPEAFLSAADTRLIQDLIANLELKYNNIQPLEESNLTNILIENITIQTTELNNNQDWSNAGKILAEEFAKASQKRGININVKK